MWYYVFPTPTVLNPASFVVRAGILGASILLVLATYILPNTRINNPLRTTIVTAALMISLGAAYYLFQGVLPAMYTSQGPTFIAHAIVALSAPLFVATTLWYYHLYTINHNSITLWFAIG
ncbi:MAG: hypothetical protein AABY13_03765, partial [Nanoarchaeota archaeon]